MEWRGVEKMERVLSEAEKCRVLIWRGNGEGELEKGPLEVGCW